jgi:hypothetical protein
VFAGTEGVCVCELQLYVPGARNDSQKYMSDMQKNVECYINKFITNKLRSSMNREPLLHILFIGKYVGVILYVWTSVVSC